MRWSACAILLCACAPAAPERLPRILGASPTGPGVAPDDVMAAVTFSDPVDSAGVENGRRVALCRAADRDAVADLAESPGGIPPDGPVVAARVALADGGKRAELRPAGPLESLASYALVVGSLTASGRPVLDPEGRRRAFVSLFDTGPMSDRTPPTPRWVLPPHGPVPRNLRSLEVAFDEPVEGALAMSSGPAGRPITLASQLLGLELESPLGSDPLMLSLAGVHDAAGNPAGELEALPVSACEDAIAPSVAEEKVVVTPGEIGLRIDAEAAELARLGVEAVSPPEEQACGALPPFPEAALVWGDMLPCAGADPCGRDSAHCSLAATVGGLCPGRRVLLRLAAEDLAGNLSPWGAWREVATLPGVARPALTEVLADAAAPEAGGEYVEVANVGTGDADLAGHALAKRSASGTLTRCVLEPLAGAIPPGGHALVIGGAYDGRYRLPDGVMLYRCGASALLGGLANDRAPALQLEAAGGEVVSSFGMAAPSLRCAERSVERIHPAGPDSAANYACARTSPGTPGACNSSTSAEECPKRPW